MPAPFALPGSNRRRWRGESGAVYEAEIVGITEAIEAGPRPGVGLAVARVRGDIRQVTRPAERITASWLGGAAAKGATEIRVVLCAPGDAARVVADLEGSS